MGKWIRSYILKTLNQTAKQQSIDEIAVIQRNDIQVLREVEVHGKRYSLGEHRDFRRHALLQQFLPEHARLSLSWVHLKEGEELLPHQHPSASMILTCSGSGYLTGQKKQALTEGDVVMVPPHCEHGFIGDGPDGFHGLSIQFGEEGGLYENAQRPQVKFSDATDEFTLEKLLAHNRKRLEETKQLRLFRMLQDGSLKDEKKRQAHLNSLEIWSMRNQLLLFTRQATCIDAKYETTFLQHFNEEIGHDVLYKTRAREENPAEDPVIEAIASWFVHQMFIRDNVEKTALIHLVIEHTSHHYHTLARPMLAKFVNDDYFAVHEADDDHAQMGIDLLKGESALTYQRLVPVIDKAWDMMNAMLDRVAYLTEQA